MTGSASGYMLEYLENPVVLNSSHNPSGADNQQERLDADWVVGFVDGEGCFFITTIPVTTQGLRSLDGITRFHNTPALEIQRSDCLKS